MAQRGEFSCSVSVVTMLVTMLVGVSHAIAGQHSLSALFRSLTGLKTIRCWQLQLCAKLLRTPAMWLWILNPWTQGLVLGGNTSLCSALQQSPYKVTSGYCMTSFWRTLVTGSADNLGNAEQKALPATICQTETEGGDRKAETKERMMWAETARTPRVHTCSTQTAATSILQQTKKSKIKGGKDTM
jgi:hypothetical protein